jgi:hypothetical protein
MVKQKRSQFSWVFMILCLCLGSLLIVAMLHILSPSILGLPLRNLEHYNSSHHVEFDETFDFIMITSLITTYLFLFKSSPANLALETTQLPPQFPPPKN